MKPVLDRKCMDKIIAGSTSKLELIQKLVQARKVLPADAQ